ncbi:hypothetical protein ACFLVX_03190 [Chloroflexota bacterium]
MSQWSQKLDAYLAMTKISKKQLALELGISINTLVKWWGRREPSPEYATGGATRCNWTITGSRRVRALSAISSAIRKRKRGI